MATTTFAFSLPSEDELLAAFQPFRRADEEALGLAHTVTELTRKIDEGLEPEAYATFEEIGHMFVFLTSMRDRLDEARRYVDDALKGLLELSEPSPWRDHGTQSDG